MQTFRAVDRMHHLTLAYEKAVEMKGNDSELLRGLFACYIRFEEGTFHPHWAFAAETVLFQISKKWR